ncbi:hypothetical protein [Sphingobium cupriresistens]|uniref:hypothetical protein n=1 Tax=Sphingobium cupriresistens TaxID=1132417 RepID=UPI000A5D0834|nr:hypothetical protein [Sphingobium cupriresistens]
MTEVIQAFCPLCSGYNFSDHRGREKSHCDSCGSLERHRLLFFYALEQIGAHDRSAFVEKGFKLPSDLADGLGIQMFQMSDVSEVAAEPFDFVFTCDSIMPDINIYEYFFAIDKLVSPGGRVLLLPLADPKRTTTDASGFGLDVVHVFNSIPRWEFEEIVIPPSKEARMRSEMRSAKLFSENQRGYVPLIGRRESLVSQ